MGRGYDIWIGCAIGRTALRICRIVRKWAQWAGRRPFGIQSCYKSIWTHCMYTFITLLVKIYVYVNICGTMPMAGGHLGYNLVINLFGHIACIHLLLSSWKYTFIYVVLWMKSYFNLIKRSRKRKLFSQGLIWHFICSANVHIESLKSSLFSLGHPTKLSTFPTKKQQGNPFSYENLFCFILQWYKIPTPLINRPTDLRPQNFAA